MDQKIKQELAELREQIDPMAEQLKQLTKKKELLEQSIYHLVRPQIEKAYKHKQLNTAMLYINVLPQDCTMRVMVVYHHNKVLIRAAEEKTE